VSSLRRTWSGHARQARFCQWLARALFTAVAPERRWRLLARFYRLPAPTIARFYALRMTWPDRLSLLAGRSPSAPLSRTAHAFEEVS
jgi:lycopene beta-cyclase